MLYYKYFPELAKELVCSVNLLEQISRDLKLDLYEDKVALLELNQTSKNYLSLERQLAKLEKFYNRFSDDEMDRLLLQGSPLLDLIQQIKLEISIQRKHRNSIIERNSVSGERDVMAHKLGELVARVFEQTGRRITFGHSEGEPTTEFTKAVKKVMKICQVKTVQIDKKYYVTNWRQPAHTAFLSRSHNTN